MSHPYVDHVLGLRPRYMFGCGDPGTTAWDRVTRALVGATDAGVARVPGPFLGARAFGFGAAQKFQHTLAMVPTAVMCFVSTTADLSRTSAFLGCPWGTAGDQIGLGPFTGSFNDEVVTIQAGAHYSYWPNTVDTVLARRWHHLLVSYTGSAWELTLDGDQKPVTAFNAAAAMSSATFQIGSGNGNGFAGGQVSEVAVFDRHISAGTARLAYAKARRGLASRSRRLAA